MIVANQEDMDSTTRAEEMLPDAIDSFKATREAIKTISVREIIEEKNCSRRYLDAVETFLKYGAKSPA